MPVGKHVTCVQCKEQFYLATDMMIAASASDSPDDSAFSLAETQAGALKSPIAGMILPVPARAPAQVPAAPAPVTETRVVDEPPTAPTWNAGMTGVVIAGAMLLLVLFIGAGTGLAYFVLREKYQAPESRPQPVAAVKLPPVAPAEPSIKFVPSFVEPKMKVEPAKKIVPVGYEAGPWKPDAKLRAKVDDATRKGIQHLKQSIRSAGTWKEDGGIHAVGYAALPGLAMLECGVPPGDPVLQQVAIYVRSQAPQVKETYDIGTAILFLDALGEPADKKLILNLAARLMAGQTQAGGWTYECPILNDNDNLKLLDFLNGHKPEVKFLIPLQSFVVDPGAKESPPGKQKPMEIDKTPIVPAKKQAPAPESLPPRVRSLPIVSGQAKKQGIQLGGTDDNSNTHFAMLGLWAARRHDAPVELTLSLAAERYQKTQAKDGGWGYVQQSPPKNTMTCVGLIALAMGHGSAAEIFAEAAAKSKTPPKKLAKDPAIQDALKAIGQYLDGDDALRGLEARIDLYYLWTLERVGILYRQDKFGKTNWYQYGITQILERQNDDGRWQVHYESPVDTAFALLFLNRSDLVEDLTVNLESYLEIPNATPRERSRPVELMPRERERPRERRQK